MYLLLLLLFPLFYLINPYLAMGGSSRVLPGCTSSAHRPRSARYRNGRPNRSSRPATKTESGINRGRERRLRQPPYFRIAASMRSTGIA